MTEVKIQNNIELVSLHIPKTAGTSFRFILKEKFRRNEVARLDIFPSGDITLNDKPFTKDQLKRKIKVIQGHFVYADLIERLDLAPNVAFITWLRNPVEMVISNYYYLNRIIAARLAEKPNENLMNRMGKTLKEFAEVEENQNIMSKFLKGADLKTFKFVGFQKNFDQELIRLCETMNWSAIDNFKYNTTESKPKEIQSDIIAFIKKCNQEDIDLYERALSLYANSTVNRK